MKFWAKFSITVRQAIQRRLEALDKSSPQSARTPHSLTCFHASFFPFCPFCCPPLFLAFSRHIFAIFSPSKSALFCRAKGTVQSLERGSSGMDLSTEFGKEIPSRNLREKRSVPVGVDSTIGQKRLSSGKVRGTSREIWGTSREVWETCGDPLDCT